ncbi:MAG: DUF1036 domain-containing protein [Bauldia sp.]|nr:DUF1036 domain-containing protein [Bauldia sp.]
MGQCSARLRSRSSAIMSALALAGAFYLVPGAGEARAEFRLCNQTESRVGVAIGYKNQEAWTTEGWWNVPSNSCQTIITGPLVSRFYYVYAVDYDLGGKWGGGFQMCTQARAFTISGYQNCVARGFEQTGFYEIDTGEQQSWTVQLTEPAQQQGIGGR